MTNTDNNHNRYTNNTYRDNIMIRVASCLIIFCLFLKFQFVQEDGSLDDSTLDDTLSSQSGKQLLRVSPFSLYCILLDLYKDIYFQHREYCSTNEVNYTSIYM